MKKCALLLTIFFMTGILAVMAQTKRITGTVTSADDGSAVTGVSVVVKGTTIGTVTNLDGIYQLDVPANATTLVFSYVGMKTQNVPIKGNVINVKLVSDAIGVDEVVVTALGIKKAEKSLGYSATKVSSDDITKTGDRSFMNSLQGKIAGVNVSSASGAPGASTRVVLRGISSLGGANQPLYIVDGIPINNGSTGGSTDINGGLDFGNRANDINPDDIQEMTVLKGASGAALYGSRAANGVILITTKKGKASKEGAKIEFSNATTFSNPLRLPKFQNEFGQGWYDGTVEANLEENGSWGPRFDGKNRVWGHIVEVLENGHVVGYQQQYKPYVAQADNLKDFFETGLTVNNAISISNGNDKSTYYLSYGNVNDDGIMPGSSDSYKRNTISLRGSSKVGEKINVSASLNYVRKDSKFVPTGQQQSVMDGIWQTPRDISIVDQKDYRNIFNNVDNYFTVYAQNPYYCLNEHGNRLRDNRIYGNVSVDYAILPWLSAIYRLGADVSNTTLKQWRAITLSSRASYNDEVGRVEESSYYNSEITSDFLLSMNKKFNDFDLSGTFGQSVNQRESRSQFAEVIGLDLPGFYNLSNSSSTPTATDTQTKRRIVGLFGTVDLAWKQMLFFNVSGRNDWSSTLPKKNRSFFYPSGSLSFLFSELLDENMKNYISYGKVRVGIAQTGNDANPYLVNSVYPQTSYTDGYRSLNFPLNSVNAFTLGNRLGNDNLKSELTTEKEIGLDVRFLQNRIGLDASVYDRSTTNEIWNVTLPSSTGYTTQTMNLGKITNKGVEIMLNFVPVKTKDLEWKVSWNFTKNNNKLVRLLPGLDQVDNGGTSAIGYVSRPGQPVGLFEGLVPLTSPDGKIVVNNKGLPLSSPVRQVYGSAAYKYTMGGSSSLTWKDFSLSASIDVRHGGLMYSRTAEMLYFTGNAAQATYNDRQPFIIPNSVQIDDNGNYVENTTPIAGGDSNYNLYYNQTYSAGKFGRLYLIDRSFVKLREVTLTYQLPKKLTQKAFINRAEISFIGRNLLLWTPKSNTFVDPESTTFGDENGLEADYGEYGATPTVRSYGFSLKLSF
ncbi:MAG: SusC/RagA family TonB-linked outer membrane protein [Bacteroidota bacterium]|nr:SusC/RagA family TonB-linked outer membrane protein [Bacteroidota bacterium]